ncbi:MAG: RHS repeat-associated core domain-containing protein [Breznakibacter sp.]
MSSEKVIYSGTDKVSVAKVADYDGDGIDDILVVKWNPGPLYDCIIYVKNTLNNVASITDGINNKVSFGYASLTTSSVYTKGSGATFPLMDYAGKEQVVSSVTADNGINGTSTTNYRYAGLKLHVQGRGSMGFASTTVENTATLLREVKSFAINSTYYFPYMTNCSVYATGDGSLISSLTYTNDVMDFGSKRIFPYTSKVVEQDVLNSNVTTTSYVYDSYGNVLTANTDYSGEGSRKVTNTYVSGGMWCPAKIQRTSVTSVVGSEPAFVRTTEYTYSTYGKVTSLKENANSSQYLTTSYEYNSFGLPAKVAVKGSDVASSRVTTYAYDAKGRFVTKETNSLGHSIYASYDTKTGNVLASTDANGFVTTNSYDGFGRLARTNLPDGNYVTYSLQWADASIVPNAVYSCLVQSSSAVPVLVYYDRLGREIRKSSKDFSGNDIYSVSDYNGKGQVTFISEPQTAPGADVIFQAFGYDKFGRTVTMSGPTETKNVSYGVRTLTMTNPRVTPKQTTQQFFNAFGQIVSVSDAGGAISYVYGSHGKPVQIISPGNVVTSMQYDDLGNQTVLEEPNCGVVTYRYNAFGELISQVKNGKSTNVEYDVLGRVQKVVDPDGTTTYVYDTRNKGKGKISSITHSSGQVEEYFYDANGRLSSKTEMVEGTLYTESIQYNSAGLPSKLIFPSGFSVDYLYNSNFYLTEIKRTDKDVTIWKADKMNARGQVEQFSLGNGLTTVQTYNLGYLKTVKTGDVQHMAYEWDLNSGNLTTRRDVKRSLMETFTYDNLDRLTSITVLGGSTVSIGYEGNGNISGNTAVGIYSYNEAQPNALARITNSMAEVPSDEQIVTYTSFDKVKLITEGTKSALFSYGVGKERVKMVLTDGTISKTRIYTHGNYEVETNATATRKLHYISSVGGIFAIFELENANENGVMYYIHKDHLGSVNVITNESGAIVEEHSFDAWGRRRNPTNWTYANVTGAGVTDHGFTGHEHLDQFGVINMNGRMYDPLVGRFFSPDRLVQNPGFSQSFNRYSYCFNNPLKYVDPTGWASQNTYGGAGETGGYDMYGRSTHDPLTGLYIPSYERPGGLYAIGHGDPRYGHWETRKTYRQYSRLVVDPESSSGVAVVVVGYSVYSSTFIWDSAPVSGVPKGQGGFNEDKAISYLKNNFILPYGAGQCINHMVPALIEGGIDGLKGKPIKAACLYGPILQNLGFVTVNRTDTYYKGDIAIIQGYDGGTYCKGSGVVCGHIQMYDGKQWLSDFPQSRPFWPGKGYSDATPSPSFEILHWGGN